MTGPGELDRQRRDGLGQAHVSAPPSVRNGAARAFQRLVDGSTLPLADSTTQAEFSKLRANSGSRMPNFVVLRPCPPCKGLQLAFVGSQLLKVWSKGSICSKPKTSSVCSDACSSGHTVALVALQPENAFNLITCHQECEGG